MRPSSDDEMEADYQYQGEIFFKVKRGMEHGADITSGMLNPRLSVTDGVSEIEMQSAQLIQYFHATRLRVSRRQTGSQINQFPRVRHGWKSAFFFSS